MSKLASQFSFTGITRVGLMMEWACDHGRMGSRGGALKQLNFTHFTYIKDNSIVFCYA